ncbi:hypothetical protein DPMN_120026 [Dreissena polymorpha]|uniref:Uncharacterized protein n=1 Tax=Dreissena polymorpha TaxID=45954 RepID=A0A9D4GMQ6_DREPO|nr:hypothetical protein DPMN_120026 [Dreissena polymorpha]
MSGIVWQVPGLSGRLSGTVVHVWDCLAGARPVWEPSCTVVPVWECLAGAQPVLETVSHRRYCLGVSGMCPACLADCLAPSSLSTFGNTNSILY